MANLNKVMFIGRLTDNPEARTFSNGGKVTKFRFAVNNRKKNQQSGQWENDPVFMDCEVFNRGEFGKQADLAEQNLRKGHQVFLEGHLKMDQWEKDGQKRSRLVVVVENFQYLEPRQDGGMSDNGSRAPRATTAPAPRRAESGYSSGGGGDSFGDEPEPMEPPAKEEDIPF